VAEEEQRSTEIAKTYFELFKHLSPLNLAAAIGVVAIGGLDLADIETTSSALLAFLASFLLSVVGLERSIDALRRDHTNLTTPYGLSIWAIAFLFVGVANLALDICSSLRTGAMASLANCGYRSGRLLAAATEVSSAGRWDGSR
jgi:hypothetical protein